MKMTLLLINSIKILKFTLILVTCYLISLFFCNLSVHFFNNHCFSHDIKFSKRSWQTRKCQILHINNACAISMLIHDVLTNNNQFEFFDDNFILNIDVQNLMQKTLTIKSSKKTVSIKSISKTIRKIKDSNTREIKIKSYASTKMIKTKRNIVKK